jgi:hypothetical protein
MKEAGEIKEVEAVGGFGGKAFVSAK